MNTIKQTIVISLAAALIVLAGLWLAETDWADSFRTTPAGFATEGTTSSDEAFANEAFVQENGENRGDMSAVTRYLSSFVKEAFLMVIPGLLTIGILQLTKRSTRRRKKTKRQQLPEAAS